LALAGAVLLAAMPVRCQEGSPKAAKYRLDGLWKSDWDRTKKHLQDDCKLDAEAVTKLGRIIGHMTVKYEGDDITYTMPELRIPRPGGSEIVLPAYEDHEKLRILGRTARQIAILDAAPVAGLDDSILVITFEDADTYWIYTGHSQAAPMQLREYFRRMKPK
jgi:hypothetical protein